MRQVEKRHSNEFLPQLIAFTAVGTSFFFFKRYSLMKPSKRNSRLNVSQSERNFKLQYHVFPVLTMWREHTVHLTAENTDEIEINFDFVGSGLSKIFLGLSHTHTHTHTHLSVAIEYEIPEHKICDCHCIAAMCEDWNSGLKRSMMNDTRYGHKQPAFSYQVSSCVCHQQTKLLAIFFLTKSFRLLLKSLITTSTSTAFSHIHKQLP